MRKLSDTQRFLLLLLFCVVVLVLLFVFDTLHYSVVLLFLGVIAVVSVRQYVKKTEE